MHWHVLLVLCKREDCYTDSFLKMSPKYLQNLLRYFAGRQTAHTHNNHNLLNKDFYVIVQRQIIFSAIKHRLTTIFPNNQWPSIIEYVNHVLTRLSLDRNHTDNKEQNSETVRNINSCETINNCETIKSTSNSNICSSSATAVVVTDYISRTPQTWRLSTYYDKSRGTYDA